MTRSSIATFTVADRNALRPTAPIVHTFAEGINSATNLAAAFKSSLAASSTSSFDAEVGLTAPFTASTSGAAGMTVNVTDSNNTSTVPVNSLTCADSVTFTPVYSGAKVIYYGEDTSPTPGSPNTSMPPYLARQRFLAALGTGRNRGTVTPPWSLTFEFFSTGDTTVVDNFGGGFAYMFGASPPTPSGPLSCTITGGTVSNANFNGAFNVTGGNSKYLRCTAGTDVVFTFTYGVTAFGFYATDVADVEGALRVYALPDDGGPEEVMDVKTTAMPSGSLLFFGFVNTAKRYTRMRVVASTPVDTFGIDEVVATDAFLTLNPTPVKAFSVSLRDAGKVAGSVYTGTVVTSAGTYNYTLPLTVTGAAGSRACWCVKLNGGHKILSVSVASSNPADTPIIDDVLFGVPLYS